MEKLARATGAKIVSNWKELNMGDLGSAGVVREVKVNDEEMIFVEMHECQGGYAFDKGWNFSRRRRN